MKRLYLIIVGVLRQIKDLNQLFKITGLDWNRKIEIDFLINIEVRKKKSFDFRLKGLNKIKK
jgi:hypothetical protein